MKGTNLQIAQTHGLPVPPFVLLQDTARALLTWRGRVRLTYPVIVRSAASLEDGMRSSAAGKYLSVRVSKPRGLADAVQRVVASYAAELDAQAVVIVQEYVTPTLSGVLFTRNPVTGAQETVIEWVRGDCAKLVQGQVTPHSGADCPRAVRRQLEQLGRQVKKVFGYDADIEWAFREGMHYLLQVRPITT